MTLEQVGEARDNPEAHNAEADASTLLANHTGAKLANYADFYLIFRGRGNPAHKESLRACCLTNYATDSAIAKFAFNLAYNLQFIDIHIA